MVIIDHALAERCRSFIEYSRRMGEGSFSHRLSEGWYPSAPRDDEGVVRHDRHVMIHVRNFEHDAREAADLLEALLVAADSSGLGAVS